MIATKTYSAMLYLLADQIDNDGPEFESAETVREAAERLDLQTVKINVLKAQRADLLATLEDIAGTVMMGIDYRAAVRAAIARAKSYGQPEKQAKNETTIPAIVFYPAGSLGEEVTP